MQVQSRLECLQFTYLVVTVSSNGLCTSQSGNPHAILRDQLLKASYASVYVYDQITDVISNLLY